MKRNKITNLSRRLSFFTSWKWKNVRKALFIRYCSKCWKTIFKWQYEGHSL